MQSLIRMHCSHLMPGLWVAGLCLHTHRVGASAGTMRVRCFASPFQRHLMLWLLSKAGKWHSRSCHGKDFISCTHDESRSDGDIDMGHSICHRTLVSTTTPTQTCVTCMFDTESYCKSHVRETLMSHSFFRLCADFFILLWNAKRTGRQTVKHDWWS